VVNQTLLEHAMKIYDKVEEDAAHEENRLGV
jgi:hypothetical protein